MYELYNGSERLSSVLNSEDEPAINRLAQILNYVPAQLKQDIKALNDRLDNERRVRKALGEDSWEKLLNDE